MRETDIAIKPDVKKPQSSAVRHVSKFLRIIFVGLLVWGLVKVAQWVSFPDMPPIHTTALKGDASTVEMYLRLGAKVDEPGPHGRTPLYYASNFAVTKVLVDHGADVNRTFPSDKNNIGTRPALSSAHDAQCLLYMLDHGADINLHDTIVEGWPLYMAVSWQDLGLVQKLVARGAKVNWNGYSPSLAQAAHSGNLRIFRYLLSVGAPVTGKDAYGDTLLHKAARVPGDNSKIVSLLLERGSDVNARNISQSTPLHMAAFGDGTIVKMLLEHHADPDLKDDTGLRPLGIAVRERSGAEKVLRTAERRHFR